MSKNVVTVKGQGHPGITTTASHRFWAKPSDRTWRNDIRQYRRVYVQPDWVHARDLADSQALWSTPIIDAPTPALDKVRAALAEHPRCDRHGGDDPVTCGWKRAVLDVQAALDGADQ